MVVAAAVIWERQVALVQANNYGRKRSRRLSALDLPEVVGAVVPTTLAAMLTMGAVVAVPVTKDKADAVVEV